MGVWGFVACVDGCLRWLGVQGFAFEPTRSNGALGNRHALAAQTKHLLWVYGFVAGVNGFMVLFQVCKLRAHRAADDDEDEGFCADAEGHEGLAAGDEYGEHGGRVRVGVGEECSECGGGVRLG